MKIPAVLFLAVLLVSVFFVETAYAQASTTQTVSMSVGSIWRISVSGSPAALVVTGGTAGADTIGVASDGSTTYSITQNVNSSARITVGTGSALPTGHFLYVRLLSGRGQSTGFVDLSGGIDQDAVTSIPLGADRNNAITYEYTATADGGAFSGSRTVTLTVTN
jgi:hypothetical protein